MSFGGNKNRRYNLNLRDFMKNVPDSKFESYVDSKGDLANAWKMINTYQQGGDMSGFAMHGNMTPAQQAQYWIKKAEGGRFSKADFGRFHAGEDKALLAGNYPGGTKVKKGSSIWDQYFPDKKTRFDQFNTGTGDGEGEGDGGSGWSGGGRSHSMVTVPEYTAPSAKQWGHLGPMRRPGSLWSQVPDLDYVDYQPWSAEAKARVLPTGLMNYIRPTIGSWEVPATQWVDWAPYQERLDEIQAREDEENSEDDDDDDDDDDDAPEAGDGPNDE